MNYSIYAPNFGQFGDARVLAALARDAEEAGWDGFFIWDHILWTSPENGPTVDPWIALAAIASLTSRIRIGALVTPVPRRHPWKIAREIVSLDHLSAGRAVLGVGIGHDAFREYSAFGNMPDKFKRGEMLDEGLDIITGLCSGEPFSYEGKYYTIKEAQFLPTPVQKPRIPVWVAAMMPYMKPLRRAARWDAVVPIGTTAILAPDDITTIKAYILQHRTTDAPFDIVIGPQRLAGNPGASNIVKEFEQAGVTWWLEALYTEVPTPFEQLRQMVRNGPPA